ncbi:hypothetical protein FA10DRAFT_270106 [Acaromyces ingoldii]|uniref:Pentacotripeptide-repeat region of PRORP domain-containing protein n=1 Tax=Acaromyces ingoldii TaxID=215250 RepID=A0A316YB24_9BASI|nr:hypothetical protein FA10DRAFT_270106 [Acaromyces ingoldii]PWN86542.1 hypothetical protein FA10DRAFT_270106 [Acaromyces ingoldii]
MLVEAAKRAAVSGARGSGVGRASASGGERGLTWTVEVVARTLGTTAAAAKEARKTDRVERAIRRKQQEKTKERWAAAAAASEGVAAGAAGTAGTAGAGAAGKERRAPGPVGRAWSSPSSSESFFSDAVRRVEWGERAQQRRQAGERPHADRGGRDESRSTHGGNRRGRRGEEEEVDKGHAGEDSEMRKWDRDRRGKGAQNTFQKSPPLPPMKLRQLRFSKTKRLQSFFNVEDPQQAFSEAADLFASWAPFVKRDTRGYRIMMGLALNANKKIAAFKYLNEMKKNGVAPNAFVYRGLFRGLAHAQINPGQDRTVVKQAKTAFDAFTELWLVSQSAVRRPSGSARSSSSHLDDDAARVGEEEQEQESSSTAESFEKTLEIARQELVEQPVVAVETLRYYMRFCLRAGLYDEADALLADAHNLSIPRRSPAGVAVNQAQRKAVAVPLVALALAAHYLSQAAWRDGSSTDLGGVEPPSRAESLAHFERHVGLDRFLDLARAALEAQQVDEGSDKEAPSTSRGISSSSETTECARDRSKLRDQTSAVHQALREAERALAQLVRHGDGSEADEEARYRDALKQLAKLPGRAREDGASDRWIQ